MFVPFALYSQHGPFLELGDGDSVSGGDAQDFPYHLSLADLDGVLVLNC